jgi:beta-xylosidase
LPNLLLQKFPAPDFTATTRLAFIARADGDRAGLLIMGTDYAWIGLRKQGDELRLEQVNCLGADVGGHEVANASVPAPDRTIYLRARVAGGRVTFSYSADGREFTPLGQEFTAKPGRWIGAKIGLFALGTVPVWEFGYADIDWFRVTAN